MLNIEYDLGFICNLKCSYCMIDKKSKPMDDDEFIKFINHKISSNYTLSFIGGEVTLHIERIVKILNKLKNKPTSLAFISNGTSISYLNRLITILKSYDIKFYLTISLDTLNGDNHRNVDPKTILTNIITIKNKYPEIDLNVNIIKEYDENRKLEETLKMLDISFFKLNLTDKYGNCVDGGKFIRNCGLLCRNTIHISEGFVYKCKILKNNFNIKPISNLNEFDLNNIYFDYKLCEIDEINSSVDLNK